MNYSTIQNISGKTDISQLMLMLNDEVRAPELIDLKDSSDPVVSRFDAAASEAKEIIDPYLSNYSLPLSPVPKRIIDLSDDLTIYCIYKRRNRENITESILSTYNQAIKALENIQKGLLKLPIDEKQAPENQGIFKVNKNSSDRVFSKDLLGRL